MRKFLTSIDLGSQQIKSLGSASADTDAPNWGQVKSWVNGLSFKNSVRVASTANVTVSSPGATIDGVTLTSGDRVLLKNQTTGSENGLYTFNGSSSAMTRTLDGVQGELVPNSTVYVNEGTTLADTQWTCTTNGTITVGSTATAWAQSGASTAYTAGSGLTLTGTAFAADYTILPKKFAANVGDGSTTAIAVTHSIGTRDVVVEVYDATTFETVDCDIVRTSTTVVTLTFAVAPASNAYRVVVIG